MALCCQATSHYLNQYWPRSLPPYGVARPQWVKTLLPLVLHICISESCVSALIQIMSCRLFGAKPLSKPVLGYCQLDHEEQTPVIYSPMSFNVIGTSTGVIMLCWGLVTVNFPKSFGIPSPWLVSDVWYQSSLPTTFEVSDQSRNPEWYG